jgi:arylsulfatase A-like enzyme
MGKFRWPQVRQLRVVLVVFGLTVLATGLFFCQRVAFPRRPNVLLITLNTTRADRLGCYGYALALTPTLDALAAEGVLFERAYTPAPLTLPSHASIMTGLYPPKHGLLINGRGCLDESVSTLAEVVRDAGYDTGAFLGSFVLNSKFGLVRGFTEYDDDMTNTDPTDDGLHRQRDGIWVVDAALKWLGRSRKQPFFCWVHLYDPHAPYLAHSDLFGDEFAQRPYDAEIAYDDRQFARLVGFLKTRGLDSRTLVVVVGDHGEGLGEHSELRHGMTLYNSTMHVPLIFRRSNHLSAGRRISTNVSMVDVSPTILELLGLSGLRNATGRSFKPALLGELLPAIPCYGETDEPFIENGWSPQRSLTEGNWKYIKTTRQALNLRNPQPKFAFFCFSLLPPLNSNDGSPSVSCAWLYVQSQMSRDMVQNYESRIGLGIPSQTWNRS